jgi:phosphoribosylformylglycinamidine synthase
MWELAEGIRGISHAASNVNINGECVPVISGNVSLYNSQPDGSSIDPTAIVCCVGVISDADKAITMNLKNPDSSIYLIGERKDECGGSAYYQLLEEMSDSTRDSMIGTNVPQPEPSDVSKQIEFVVKAISDGNVRTCHDVSNGGLLLALFEMTLSNRGQGGSIGVEIELDALGSDLSADKILFSETGGFLCEVSPDNEEAFLKAAQEQSVEVKMIGKTIKSPTLKVLKSGDKLVDLNLSEITDIWTLGLKKAMNP